MPWILAANKGSPQHLVCLIELICVCKIPHNEQEVKTLKLMEVYEKQIARDISSFHENNIVGA